MGGGGRPLVGPHLSAGADRRLVLVHLAALSLVLSAWRRPRSMQTAALVLGRPPAAERGRRQLERCDAPVRDRSRSGHVALRAKLPAAGTGLVRVAVLRRLKSAAKGSRFERCEVPAELWRGLARNSTFRWELALEGPGAWEPRKQYLVRLRCEHESGAVWETHPDKATAIEMNSTAAATGPPSADAGSSTSAPAVPRASASSYEPTSSSSTSNSSYAAASAKGALSRETSSTKRLVSSTSPPARERRGALVRHAPDGSATCELERPPPKVSRPHPSEARVAAPQPCVSARMQSCVSAPVLARPLGPSIEDRLAVLEQRAFDKIGTRGIFPRLVALEKAVFPDIQGGVSGTPSQRCLALEAELGCRREPENLD